MYAAEAQVCGACAMKNRCTSTTRRWITRHLHEGALQRMSERATAQLMRLRRCTVEKPVAVLKPVILETLASCYADVTEPRSRSA